MSIQMDEIDRIYCLLRSDHLEAQLVLYEIARVGFNAEIDSPETTPERRAQAIARRDASLVEWGEIMTELEELRNKNSRA
jgi:hypothetical protein